MRYFEKNDIALRISQKRHVSPMIIRRIIRDHFSKKMFHYWIMRNNQLLFLGLGTFRYKKKEYAELLSHQKRYSIILKNMKKETWKMDWQRKVKGFEDHTEFLV